MEIIEPSPWFVGALANEDAKGYRDQRGFTIYEQTRNNLFSRITQRASEGGLITIK